LPDGVTAARLTLDQLVKVRILLRQLSKYPHLRDIFYFVGPLDPREPSP
jgi:signal transduction histidine kinase